MTNAWRSVRRYLGLSGDEDRSEASDSPASWLRLRPVRRALIRGGVGNAALALGCCVVLAAGFGWEGARLLTGVLAGAGIFGVIVFLGEVRRQIPRGWVFELPVGAQVEPPPPPPWRDPHLVLLVPLVGGAAWIIDRWDVPSVIFPGMLAGQAAANLLGAALVWRWERSHDQRVHVRADGHADSELFASTAR